MKAVAKVLLIDGDGGLLVLNRSMTHPHYPGHFDLPGGAVEAGEQWDAAAAREVREETGVVLPLEQLKQAFALQRPGIVRVLYVAKLDERPAVSLSWEHQSYQWLSVEELLALAIPEAVDGYYLDVLEFLKTNPQL